MRLREYTIKYLNEYGDIVYRYTYAEDVDTAVANYYQSSYSHGSEFLEVYTEISTKKEK